MNKQDAIQDLQNQVFRMRDQFDSSSGAFLGFTLAWESLRLVWYAARGENDDARGKFELVKLAFEDLERWMINYSRVPRPRD